MYQALPVEDGVRCAVDEYGFYVLEDDQIEAPPVANVDEAVLKEEAFWLTSTVQYSFLKSLALSRAEEEKHVNGARTPKAARQQRTPNRISGSPHDGEDSVSENASFHRFVEATRCNSRGEANSESVLMKMLLRKTRQRVRRHGGIPFPRLRKLVWRFFSGASLREARSIPSQEGCSAVYRSLVNAAVEQEVGDVISRDLGRTFPTHCLFRDSASVGQTELRRVLHAYSVVDAEVGYCQGMGFVVAVLLLHLPEEDSFWVFLQMMQSRMFAMRQLYLPGFPLLQQFFIIFRRLFRRLLPNLMSHFDVQGVDVSFFASQWFLTLFAYQFPITMVSRIWDLFFAEGWKFIFKVSMALLQWEQEKLQLMRMEEILLHLKTVHEGKSADELLRRAMDVPIHERDMSVDE